MFRRGRVQGESTIKVTVPAGVTEGNYITLAGQGNAGPGGGGPAGDLIVIMEKKPQSNFKRNGDDIIFDLWIAIQQQSMGGDVEVPTLTGKGKARH